MLTQLDLRNIIRIEENRKEVNKMNARIEAVRKHEGLTQEQFADRTFKKRFVEMLAGLSPADWELLERMAEKLTQKKEESP